MNLLATSLQLTFLAALFLWAKAPRLGPAREDLPQQHRSSLEYVSAMANLAQSAGHKAELVAILKTDFRRFLQDELAILVTETWEEADAQLAGRRTIEQGALLRASQNNDFLSLSQQLATLEQKVRNG